LTDNRETKAWFEIERWLESECYTTTIVRRTGDRCC